MVFRRQAFRFGYRSVKKKTSKWIQNEQPKTYNDQVFPQLPFMVRSKEYRIKSKMDNTLEGQLYGLTFSVTNLFRDERVILNYNRAVEVRYHTERLLHEALRNGDKHRPTMALANYWLREKNLIHKLFKVLVPRYADYPSSLTSFHMLGIKYELAARTIKEVHASKETMHPAGEVVLELKGNNLPPIIRPRLNRSELLTNVLLDSVRLSNEASESQESAKKC